MFLKQSFMHPRVAVLLKIRGSQLWRHTPLISAFRRQRQEDLYEFEDSLIYIMNYRAAKTKYWDSISKKKIIFRRIMWINVCIHTCMYMCVIFYYSNFGIKYHLVIAEFFPELWVGCSSWMEPGTIARWVQFSYKYFLFFMKYKFTKSHDLRSKGFF